ncbi:hypothetical protein [Vibrio mediterranei]|uniref:hypothetical protein n=1 Tax=Vibrio mediterranei TaxID=689 RepID=UPI0040676E2F
MSNLNKSIVILGSIAAVSVGAYSFSACIVDRVANELTHQIPAYLSEQINEQYFTFEVIETNVRGAAVNQRFALYPNSSEDKPSATLYFDHVARISPFGSSVSGKLSLPKDVGFAARFVDEVTVINEDIQYTYQTKTAHLNLKANVGFGDIVHPQLEVAIGDFKYHFLGTLDTNKSTLALDGLTFKDGMNSLELGKGVFNLAKSHSEVSSSSTIDAMSVSGPMGHLAVSGVDLKGNLTTGEKVDSSFDWRVSRVDSNIYGMPAPFSTIGLSGTIKGLDATKVDLSAFEAADPSEQRKLFFDIAGSGVELEDLNFFLDDLTVQGKLSVPAADYTNLSPQESSALFNRVLEAEFEIRVPQAMAESFEYSLPEVYWEKTNGSYVTQVTVSDGEVHVLGHRVF